MAAAVPDEATWLALREKNIGGSEVASLFYRWRHTDGSEAVYHMYEAPPAGSQLLGCLNPYLTGYRLWQQKAGRLMPEDLANVERVQAGNFLEPALAQWAGRKWDWKLRKVRRYCTHRDVEGWGASLDYEVHENGLPPVEIKNVDGVVFRDQWVIDGDEILMPPLHYVLQIQHQIGAVGADHGWVVCCVGGNRLVRGRIERHEGTQTKIADAIREFWRGVKTGVEPTWIADFETVADEYRYGGSESVDLTGDAELPAICKAYLEEKRKLDEQEVVVDNLKAKIAAALGEASKGRTVGFNVSWPLISRPEKVIPERVQAALTYRGGLTVRIAKEA